MATAMDAATGAQIASKPRMIITTPWNRNSFQWALNAFVMARCISLSVGSTAAMRFLLSGRLGSLVQAATGAQVPYRYYGGFDQHRLGVREGRDGRVRHSANL